MKFKTVKTILTAAQEKKQYGEIDLKSGSCCNFFFNLEPEEIIGYNSDTEVISVLKGPTDVYIDCEAIESITVHK